VSTSHKSSSPRLSSQERRSAIIDAAIELFAERGFRGVTTRELAAAVGVSEPVLYQHFPSKKDIYAAIIEATMDRGYYEALEGLSQMANSASDEDFFRHLARAMSHWYETKPQEIRLKLFSALESHGMMEEFHDKTSRPFLDIVTSYIARRMEEGAFQNHNPQATALAFCGMVGHSCQAKLLFRSSLCAGQHEEMIEVMVQLFLNGVRKPN
jgi:AcrR family transcriptional regulator